MNTFQSALEFAQVQYGNGSTSYLNVLDAQRTLYTAQQSLVQRQLSRQNSQVTLYKALGGGWDPATAG